MVLRSTVLAWLLAATLSASLATSLTAGLSFAAELEIPLLVVTPPDPYSTQVIPFEFDLPFEQVEGIALRLQGTYEDQLFLCGDVPYDIETAAGRVMITLGDDVLVAPEAEVVHSFPANPDDPLPFDITEILLEGEAGSWPFLADGAGQIGIADHARPVYDDNNLLCPPGSVFGTLTAAILIITYDSPVSTESSTWGAIKGIYR
jgi:hypothetical protein